MNSQRYKTSEALTGTTTFYYPSGTYYGRIPQDSPIIKELGLIHIRSEKQKAQDSTRNNLMLQLNKSNKSELSREQVNKKFSTLGMLVD
jgi:hypothetical protein